MDLLNKKPAEPQQEQDNPYSKDKDQTRFLRMAFTLALTTLLGLFLLEYFHPVDSPVFFTAEINHILINGLLIGFISLGAFVYGKQAGMNEALAKMAGGGNGNQKKDSKEETR